MISPQISFTILGFLIVAMFGSHPLRRDMIRNIHSELCTRIDSVCVPAQRTVEQISPLANLLCQQVEITLNGKTFFSLIVSQFVISVLIAVIEDQKGSLDTVLTNVYLHLLTYATVLVIAVALSLLRPFIRNPHLNIFSF
jgi:hypothetical protein